MVSGEKRNCDGDTALEKAAAILLDVEGTTTSISFVKDTLFPYVRDNLQEYVDSHWNNDEFKEDLEALKSQAKKDEEEKLENFIPIEEGDKEKESLIKNVLWQMDLDRKTTALKQLQGHIWREGYKNGKLKGQVFSDVAPMFKKWCEDDRKLYIYSSGSVEAQKLLFKNSEGGDLEVFIAGHFDTEVGPKTEATSYTTIAGKIGFEGSQILFLTDSVKEAVAADKAGLQVTLVVRDGNSPLTDEEKKAFSTVSSFNELVFESSNKKKKICEDGQEGDNDVGIGAVEPEPEKPDEKMEVESSEEGKTVKIAEGIDGEESEPTEKVTVTSSVDETTNGTTGETQNGEETSAVSATKTEENGHEAANGEAEKVGNGKGEDEDTEEEKNKNVEEVNGSEANGKSNEETPAEGETVVVKKIAPEEQADSTVEVTA